MNPEQFQKGAKGAKGAEVGSEHGLGLAAASVISQVLSLPAQLSTVASSVPLFWSHIPIALLSARQSSSLPPSLDILSFSALCSQSPEDLIPANMQMLKLSSSQASRS